MFSSQKEKDVDHRRCNYVILCIVYIGLYVYSAPEHFLDEDLDRDTHIVYDTTVDSVKGPCC